VGTPASLSTPSTAAVTTAIKNANTGVNTATPGIIDHTAQIGRLPIASNGKIASRQGTGSTVSKPSSLRWVTFRGVVRQGSAQCHKSAAPPQTDVGQISAGHWVRITLADPPSPRPSCVVPVRRLSPSFPAGRLPVPRPARLLWKARPISPATQ